MTAIDSGQAAEVPLHRGAITVSVMLATIMQAVDMTIANVALPNMQGTLSTTQDQIAWVITSYLVASAIMMPPTGFLARRLGRKRLFLLAITGFTLTSVLCGIADSLEEIVLYRVLQGACGAFLVPLSQAILLDSHPREQHGKAMAIWGVGFMLGPILGPTIGGYLTEYYHWRWVFFINVPIGVLALAGVLAFVPETERHKDRRFDWFGFALIALAIGGFQIMLDRAELKDWFESTEIIAEAVIAGLALYMFVVHSATAKRPFVDPHVFADRNMATGLVLIFIFGGLLVTTLAILPPYLQNLMDYPVDTVGAVLAPRGMGAMLGMMIVSRIINNVDSRWLMVIGILLVALSLWQMTGFTADVDPWSIVWTGVIQGIGLGLFYVPLSVMSFSTLGEHLRTEAAGMFNLMRNIGSSIGVSVVVGLLIRNTQINHEELVGHITPFSLAVRAPFAPELWSLSEPAGLIALNDEITRQAAAIAYVNDFYLLMVVSVIVAPLPLLFRRA